MSTIVVTPEHNELARFQSMRLAPYSTAEVLAELIDNCNSARRKGQSMVRVDINVYQDPQTQQYILSVQDNASGIQDTLLGKVLGQANSIGGGTNNEHGMGLKQAAFTGKTYLRSIETRTVQGATGRKAEFTKAEDVLQAFEVNDSALLKGPGTRLEIVLPPEHPLLKKGAYYDALSQLQVIYQKVLDVSLHVVAKNDALGLPAQTLQADAASAQLHNPIKGDSSWIVEKTFKSTGKEPWSAEVRIGFIDDSSFKPFLAAPPKGQRPLPTDKTQHGRGIEKQGIFIFKGDRLIQKTADWKLESPDNILDGRLGPLHNSLNGLVFEIHFDAKFPTTPTKNRLKEDTALIEFREQLVAYLRRIQPAVADDQPVARSEALYRYLMEWNDAKKHKINPAEDLPWHHKQAKYKTNWKSLGKFGVWDLWRHGDKVLVVHKHGFDAAISPSDIPEMKALSKHIQEKTKGQIALPLFVHNDRSQLDFTHYSEQYRPRVITAAQSTKEMSQKVLDMSPEKQAIRDAIFISSSMSRAMLKLPLNLRKSVLELVQNDLNLAS